MGDDGESECPECGAPRRSFLYDTSEVRRLRSELSDVAQDRACRQHAIDFQTKRAEESEARVEQLQGRYAGLQLSVDRSEGTVKRLRKAAIAVRVEYRADVNASDTLWALDAAIWPDGKDSVAFFAALGPEEEEVNNGE